VSVAGRSRSLVGAIVFLASVAAFSRVPLLPQIGRYLSLSVSQLGLLTTALGIGRLAMDLPAGRLAAAVGAERSLVGAGLALAAACALLASAHSFAQALVASAVIGCATALVNTTGMYVFAVGASSERRGASMALYTSALMGGMMAGPVVGGALGSLAGWRAAIWLVSPIGAAIALACLVSGRVRLLPARGAATDPPAAAARDAGTAPAAADPGAAATDTGAAAAAAAPSRRELVALGAVPFASFFATAGLLQTLAPVIGDGELRLSPSAIGLTLGLGTAARFVTAWTSGTVSDRVPRRLVIVPTVLLMALGALLLALPAGFAGWLGAIVLVAVGSSGVGAAAAALADRVPAERLGRELGLFRLVGDLGLLLGPAAVGFAFQDLGTRAAGGIAAGVVALAALACALWGAPRDSGARRARRTVPRPRGVDSGRRRV